MDVDLLVAGTLVMPDGIRPDGWVAFGGGRIVRTGSGQPPPP